MSERITDAIARLDQGCGSEEFRNETQERRDALCAMVAEVRRRG